MSFRKRVFHKFVDDIMEDGQERSTSSIIELLKDTMGGKDKYGRNRTAFNVPLQRKLSYYLRINNEYIHLDRGTRQARWVKR